MGVYELLIMNDVLREMVVAEASLDDFRNECRKSRHADPPRSGPAGDPFRPDLGGGDPPRDHARRGLSGALPPACENRGKSPWARERNRAERSRKRGPLRPSNPSANPGM